MTINIDRVIKFVEDVCGADNSALVEATLQELGIHGPQTIPFGKRIYVAGLITRNPDGSKAGALDFLRNIRAGQVVCLYLLRLGFAVFCPFQDYQYGLLSDDPIPEMAYKGNSMAWLEVSDAVLVISGEGIGSGVDAEIKRANELKIPVYHNVHSSRLNIKQPE